jgi:cobalamin synthase
MSCFAAACGMLAVLLPSYAWFGPPAILSVQSRDDRTTADNFYQLFSDARHGFLMQHIGLVATILVIGLAIVTLSRLPGRSAAQPAIFAALALSTAWLFLWQYQLPSYEAMVICLLILMPAGWLDWLVITRLTAATIALMPGNPTPLRSHLLVKIAYDLITLIVPIVLLAVVAALVAGCLLQRRRRQQKVAPAS